ncbi:4931400O07Rik [Phodopus roborovskii]|uniref:4931400O07Rik protein n=1 Tax=Phodopus roborovskii TaxID=109678 RepID=A0AAU9YXI8_PHORO|nr:4931400O07Rik [Phodopus roborovskii]
MAAFTKEPTVSKEPEVNEEMIFSEKPKGSSSQAVSESNCDYEPKTRTNTGGQSTFIEKRRHHGCSWKSKRSKKVWKVVTKIKSVFENNSENYKEERKHIVMTEEGPEEHRTTNNAVFPSGSSFILGCSSSSLPQMY